MSEWLVVLIAAPLASFGEEPGNARRGTADRPSRSALLGLAGAALGIERADGPRQQALRASFLTATRTLRPGELLTDFHTSQSLPAGKGPVATRADALAKRGDLETSITRRDYRSDGLWQAAFAATGGAVSLEELRDAFQKPRFALWAGRKSCPLAHPLAPAIVPDADLEAAFLVHGGTLACPGSLCGRFRKALAGEIASTIAVDDRLPAARSESTWRRRRNDEPGDRLRWHFSARYERVYRLQAKTPNLAGERHG